MSEKISPTISPEEYLGPPKIDMVGFLLIVLLSLVVGLFVGIGVFILSYIFFGNFTLQSGISPLLMSMITFFVLIGANYLYTAGLSVVFPHIYSRSRTIFIQVSVFSILLYVMMALVYFLVGSMVQSLTYMLVIYTIHVMLDIFGLLLLTGILSLYRYVVLYIYSGLLALIVSGLIAFALYVGLSVSSQALFVLMLFGGVAFVLNTVFVFGFFVLYSLFYRFSGSDPIGVVFSDIEKEEKDFEKKIESTLFSK